MVEPEASAPSALDTLSERVRKSFAVMSTGTLSSVSEQKPTEKPTEKPTRESVAAVADRLQHIEALLAECTSSLTEAKSSSVSSAASSTKKTHHGWQAVRNRNMAARVFHSTASEMAWLALRPGIEEEDAAKGRLALLEEDEFEKDLEELENLPAATSAEEQEAASEADGLAEVSMGSRASRASAGSRASAHTDHGAFEAARFATKMRAGSGAARPRGRKGSIIGRALGCRALAENSIAKAQGKAAPLAPARAAPPHHAHAHRHGGPDGPRRTSFHAHQSGRINHNELAAADDEGDDVSYTPPWPPHTLQPLTRVANHAPRQLCAEPRRLRAGAALAQHAHAHAHTSTRILQSMNMCMCMCMCMLLLCMCMCMCMCMCVCARAQPAPRLHVPSGPSYARGLRGRDAVQGRGRGSEDGGADRVRFEKGCA